MATSFGTNASGMVVLRVHRAGAHARVRVFIGQEGSEALTGELTMTRQDWQVWRRCLPEHDPSRLRILFADGGTWEWLNQSGGES